MKEAECISFIQQEFLAMGDYDPSTFKIPLSAITSTIQDVIGLRDKEAIHYRKVAILRALELKQIQEGRQHFVVHISYYGKDKDEVQSSSEFLDIKIKIDEHPLKRMSENHIKRTLGDANKYQKFLEQCSQMSIEVTTDEDGEKVFSILEG